MSFKVSSLSRVGVDGDRTRSPSSFSASAPAPSPAAAVDLPHRAPRPRARRPLARPRAQPAIVPSGPPPKIMPVSPTSSPGMVGEAYTVFAGTKPEPFKVRVVSVVRNFLPKQDVILIRAEDPRVEFSGIAAGMSGSPVYIDGKLVGAIAYAWAFAKEPLAGVTPIESDAGRAQPPAAGDPQPGRVGRAGARSRARPAAGTAPPPRANRNWRLPGRPARPPMRAEADGCGRCRCRCRSPGCRTGRWAS